LARCLRPVLLPGEQLPLKIVREGNQKGQGVGYLNDGTMVVVNNAQHLTGRAAAVVVQSLHQTGAGIIIFAELAAEPLNRPDGTDIMKFVTVYRSFSPADAQLIRSRLEAAGFLAQVAHELSALSMDGYALAAGGIRVQVPEDVGGGGARID
jgi:hypothetical protein